MKVQYTKLMGKSKQEVLEEMGEGYNFYPSNEWSYTIGTNFLKQSTILYLTFDEETQRVIHMTVKRKFLWL